MASSQAQIDEAHIPVTLKDPLLVMRYSQPSIGNIPTIFVGIVHREYTDQMWDNHKSRICSLFGITDVNSVGEIKVRGAPGNTVDGAQLERDRARAIESINQLQIQSIRIVGLGVGSSISVTDALESIICGWAISPADKEIQFVALGESEDCHYLNFCKGLVLKKTCKILEYYNTMDYSQFGDLRPSNKPRTLLKRFLQSVLADMTK